jgi:hypothetical protein
MFRFDLRAVLAYCIGFHMNTKFLAIFIVPMHGKRDGERDSLCAAPFFTAKVQ